MSLAVRLAVLVVLVTSLESGVPQSKRKLNPKHHVRQESSHRKGINAPAKSSDPKKSHKKTQLKEFPLEAILFKGRETNEANAFIKSNVHKGKTLEQHYEKAREQDLNEIEERLLKVYQDYKHLITS